MSIETSIHADLSAIRAAIPDAQAVIRLNPLVVDAQPDPGDTEIYRITDRLRFLGVPFHLRYRARIRFVEAGIDSEVWAATGFHIFGRIRFEPRGEVTLVREQIDMTVLYPLAGYTLRTTEAGHRTMWETLRARVETAPGASIAGRRGG